MARNKAQERYFELSDLLDSLQDSCNFVPKIEDIQFFANAEVEVEEPDSWNP